MALHGGCIKILNRILDNGTDNTIHTEAEEVEVLHLNSQQVAT